MDTTFSRPSPILALVGDDARLVGTRHLLGFHPGVDTQQARHGEAPDVGVEDADREPPGGEGCGQVDGDRALPHPALAGGDRQDPAVEWHLGVGGVLTGVPAGLGHDLAALVARHLAPRDGDVAHAGVQPDPPGHLVADLRPQWAALDGELDPDGDDAVVVDLDVGDHPERDDVGTQFGVDHRPEDLEHLVAARWRTLGSGGRHPVSVSVVVDMTRSLPGRFRVISSCGRSRTICASMC